MAKLLRHVSQLGILRGQTLRCSFSTSVQNQISTQRNANAISPSEDTLNKQTRSQYSDNDAGGVGKHQRGQSMEKKMSILVNTLEDLKDSKEAVYGALDSWLAGEQSFPIGRLKSALLNLEREHQWHRVVQVIKWMLSKGQGNTIGTYGQLIRALDMDQRVEEAQKVWEKKVGRDVSSVPWKVCDIMISVYYRNNMLEDLVRLFKSLEAYDRKPQEKSIVQKVAYAYEKLGLLEEKEQVLEKYKSLFTQRRKVRPIKSKESPSKRKDKSGQRKSA